MSSGVYVDSGDPNSPSLASVASSVITVPSHAPALLWFVMSHRSLWSTSSRASVGSVLASSRPSFLHMGIV